MPARGRHEARTEPRAIIYARISKDVANDPGMSTTRQVARCRELCERHGYRVVGRPYVDDDISASKYARRTRPQYRRMVDDLNRGAADVLVAVAVDRVTRDTRKSYAEVVATLDARGLIFDTITDGTFDVRTARGAKQLHDAVGEAAYEVARLSERVLPGKAWDREHGRWLGGKVPFGYRSCKRDGRASIEPDEASAWIVRDAAARVAGGESLSSVVRDYNGRANVTPPGGGTWKTSNLSRMLARPALAGLVEQADGSYVDAEWPGVIDADTFRRLRDTFAGNVAKRPGRPRAYLLTGLCVTPDGAPLFGNPACAAMARCYRTVGVPRGTGVTINADELDDDVTAAILRYADSATLPTLADTPGTAALEVDALRARLAELAERSERHGWDDDEYEAHARGIRAALADARARAEREEVITLGRGARALARPGALRASWPELSTAERREAIGMVVDRIIVRRKGAKHGERWTFVPRPGVTLHNDAAA